MGPEGGGGGRDGPGVESPRANQSLKNVQSIDSSLTTGTSLGKSDGDRLSQTEWRDSGLPCLLRDNVARPDCPVFLSGLHGRRRTQMWVGVRSVVAPVLRFKESPAPKE